MTVPGLTSKVPWESIVTGAVSILTYCTNHIKLQNGLKALEPDIARLKPDGGGVLILTEYWTTEILGGQRIFQRASALRGGKDLTTLKNYEEEISRTGIIYQTPPNSWKREVEYLWVT